MKDFATGLLACERGATAIDYAFLIGLISLALFVVMQVMGNSLVNVWNYPLGIVKTALSGMGGGSTSG